MTKTPVTWEYTTTDGVTRYLLANDLEHAAWSACELAGGTKYIKNIRRADEWR